MTKAKKQTQAPYIDPADLPTSATDLMCALENGDADEVRARIQTLSRRDFIQVMQAVQQLDSALSAYALSWKNAEYWGHGESFPAEMSEAEAERIRAEVEAAGKIAHQVAGATYKSRYTRTLDAILAIAREEDAAA